MSEQEYDKKYIFFILSPAIISLVTSSLLMLNYFFISKHLKVFMYHKLSASLGFFDVVQQIGTILGAPFLFSADENKCAYREYLFLFGSFCKTLTVLFISGTISYVIYYSKVPSKELMRWCIAVFGVFTGLCFVIMPSFNATATLCKDPTAGNFSLESVAYEARVSFIVCYVVPVVISYFTIIILVINTGSRLREMFNAALMKLLVRLLPGPIIFSMALLPSAIFQMMIMTTDRSDYVVKRLALLGMNLSGAMYATFYCYECIRDGVFFPNKFTASDRKRLKFGTGESSAPDVSADFVMDSTIDKQQSSSVEIEFESSMGRGSSFMLPGHSDSSNGF